MKKLLFLAMFIATSTFAQNPYSGVATHFDALGEPFGGCGVPPDLVDTEYYVALNVYNSPGNGTMWPRPLKGADTIYKGEFNNGRNCGRWVKVSIMEDCIGGTNDGALGQKFCRGANAKWTNDSYSYAYLNMIVTDACGDNNGWCRDSKYHLDLHTSSLNNFVKDGKAVADMNPTHFNNRKIEWEYIKAPNYSGDVDIYFMQNAQQYWASVLINHLENGIHGVEQNVNGNWVKLKMNSDMGQTFLMETSAQPYRIRILDAEDKYIKNGREYLFSYPSSCGNKCTAPATKVTYQTNDPIITNTTDQGNTTNEFYLYSANGQNVVVWQLANSSSSLEVTDLIGKTLNTIELNSPNGQVELNGLSKGIYRVVMKAGREILGSKLFFIQ